MEQKGDGTVINNPSDYVVRITASFKTLPSGKAGVLDKTYILPHTSIKQHYQISLIIKLNSIRRVVTAIKGIALLQI